MANCLDYSCPIVLPTGLPGTPGTTGAAGANGVALLKNSCATAVASSGTGNQTLATYTLTANKVGALDKLRGEALFLVPRTPINTFTVRLKVGASTVASKTITVASGIIPMLPTPIPVTNPYGWIKLEFSLLIKTTGTEIVTSIATVLGTPDESTSTTISALTLDMTSSNVCIAEVTTADAGDVITCYYFILEQYKYTA